MTFGGHPRSIKRSSRKLLLLLLFIAGIEQNPGPYICPACLKNITRRQGCVQCSDCQTWTHLSCSTFKKLKERSTLQQWLGPCCAQPPAPPTPRPPSLTVIKIPYKEGKQLHTTTMNPDMCLLQSFPFSSMAKNTLPVAIANQISV